MGPEEEEDTQPFDRAQLDALLRASRPPPEPAPDFAGGSVSVLEDDGETD